MTNAEILDKIERMLYAVRVVQGIHDESVDGLVEKTVLAVRNQFAKEFGIPDDAVFMVNGEVVQPDFVLQKADVLEFFFAAARVSIDGGRDGYSPPVASGPSTAAS
jgi:hypothetical protein